MGYYSCGIRTTAPIIIVPILGVELTVIIQFSIHSDSLGGGPSWDGVGYGVLPVTLVCHRKRPIDATSVHVQNPSVAAAGNVAARPIFWLDGDSVEYPGNNTDSWYGAIASFSSDQIPAFMFLNRGLVIDDVKPDL